MRGQGAAIVQLKRGIMAFIGARNDARVSPTDRGEFWMGERRLIPASPATGAGGHRGETRSDPWCEIVRIFVSSIYRNQTILAALRCAGVRVLSMVMSAEVARQRAAQLLAMSLEASRDGGFQLADLLADVASKYLDRADELECAHDLRPRHRGGNQVASDIWRFDQTTRQEKRRPTSSEDRSWNPSGPRRGLTPPLRHKGYREQ